MLTFGDGHFDHFSFVQGVDVSTFDFVDWSNFFDFNGDFSRACAIDFSCANVSDFDTSALVVGALAHFEDEPFSLIATDGVSFFQGVHGSFGGLDGFPRTSRTQGRTDLVQGSRFTTSPTSQRP